MNPQDRKETERKRLLKIVDLDDAAFLMARAFQEDPLMKYLISDPAKRVNMLPKFFKVFLKTSILNHQAFGVGAASLEGVVIWSFPHQKRIDFTGLFQAGLLKLVFEGFLFPFLKAIKVFRTIEDLQTKYLKEDDYYLNFFAVAPECQGHGCASKLVKPFLKNADLASAGVYVDTMTLSNTKMYEHFGFRLRERDQIRDDFNIWALYRNANSRKNST